MTLTIQLNSLFVGNARCAQLIRKTAIPLMQQLVERFFAEARAAPYQLSVTSVLPTTYQQSQVYTCVCSGSGRESSLVRTL